MDKNLSPQKPDSKHSLDSLLDLMQEMDLLPDQTVATEVEVVAEEQVMTRSPQSSMYAETKQDDRLLQELLAELVFGSGRQPDFTPLEYKIKQLEQQLHDPEEVITLLLPVISELLNRKVTESKDSIVRAIVPIIDQVMLEKTVEDKQAMIEAISALIPGAIDQQVRGNPEDLIEALAPAMGETIKQQIRVERDAMVDALYPVIGSTISKYMQEVVKEINSRVESTFTPQGIQRKLRAKMRGVSEAELILQESMPFQVQAVFLIHKTSGLIISSAQKNEDDGVEGDLMAGMLTAMRSFASECVLEGGNQSELKEIEYESFNIVMEVAGYCYLATIIKGDVEPNFIKKMRKTLGHIILHYDRDRQIHDYTGDPRTIHPDLHQELEKLLGYVSPQAGQTKASPPLALLVILLLPLMIWGGFSWSQQRQLKAFRAIAAEVNQELSVDPQLAVYPIQADFKKVRGDRQLILSGKIPSTKLKTKAEKITQNTLLQIDPAQNWQVVNEIVAVEVAPDPEAIAAEINRLTTVLNQDKDLLLIAQYDDPQVIISGHLRTETKLQQVINAYSQIPGVNNVLVTATAKPFPIDQQLYFPVNSARINPNDEAEKLSQIYDFLRQYPELRLAIIGYIYPTEAAALAEKRAIAVQNSLLKMGVNPQQLTAKAAPAPPPNLTQADDPWISRTVRFERMID